MINKTIKKLSCVLAVVFSFFLASTLNQNAFADLWQGNPGSPDLGACSSDWMCYAMSTKYGGGLVWLYYKFPDNTGVLDFNKVTVLYGQEYTDVDNTCKGKGTDGAYILTQLWHFSNSYQFAGYLYGPTIKSTTDYPKLSVDAEEGYDYRFVNYKSSDGSMRTVSHATAYKKYLEYGGTQSSWNAGDFSVFCGSDPDKTNNEYSSKSNVYSSGAGTVSSNWVNNGTDKNLQISATPGSTVTISFNHYLKASTTASSTTKWNVKRTMSSTHSGVTFTDTNGTSSNFTSLGNPVSGTLATSDKNEHTVPNAGGSGYGRTVEVSIPAASSAGESYSIQICEYLTYQGDNTKSTALDKGSHVCATINVSSTSLSSTCPLPTSLYTPPAKGTADSGTTASGSGIISNVFTTYSSLIYVKPHDHVSWAHCYNPEAQTVLRTAGDHSDPEDKSYGTDEPIRNASSTVGSRTEKVAGQNIAKLSTTNTSSFTPGTSFFSPSADYSISGNTLTGTIGNNSGAVIYSASEPLSYAVQEGYAGTRATQSLSTDKGTNSVVAHKTWTWKYTYKATNGCVDVAAHWEINEDDPDDRTWVQATYKDCDKEGTGYGEHNTNYYATSSQTSWGESSSASYYIPYNFTTSGSSNITGSNLLNNDGDQIVISGEGYTVSGSISILPRYNATTQGEYTTEPPSDTKAELVTFYLSPNSSIPNGSSSASVSSVCNYYNSRGVSGCTLVNEKTGEWGHPDYSNGSTYDFSAKTMSGYDLEIGSLICSAVGINHADSGDDTNGGGTGQVNNNWYISSPTCRTVAKKPNLQVWGSSVFTNGLIKTSTALKTKADETKTYETKTYGSWSEFAIIAGGNNSQVSGMGSGAVLSGGNNNSAFYIRTPLSIPNSECNSSGCTRINGSGITGTATITNRLISRFTSMLSTPLQNSSDINLSVGATSYAVYGKYRVTYTKADTTISYASELPAGVTHIVYVEQGNLVISADIVNNQDNNGSKYKNPEEIPQYIIIVKNGDIIISPNVERIDAWLIAENGAIKTCGGLEVGAFSNETCGRSLTINGPVIAKKIIANRTYGAGTGSNTGTPAEIFNLPLSSYLWAYAQAYDDAKIYTVYTRQLAPRL